MRFSTLTVVVFVAHTSTEAIAAPLPFYDDVQDLVARTDSENWASVASKLAGKVPAPLLNIPLKSDVAGAIHKVISVAANAGPYRTGDYEPHIPLSPTLRETNPILDAWNKKTGNLFTHPNQGGMAASPAHRAPKLMRRDPEIDELD